MLEDLFNPPTPLCGRRQSPSLKRPLIRVGAQPAKREPCLYPLDTSATPIARPSHPRPLFSRRPQSTLINPVLSPRCYIAGPSLGATRRAKGTLTTLKLFCRWDFDTHISRFRPAVRGNWWSVKQAVWWLTASKSMSQAYSWVTSTRLASCGCSLLL